MSPRMNAAEGNPQFSAQGLHQLSELSEQDYNERLERIKSKDAFIIDLDGVIYQGNVLLPGVRGFVEWLQIENKKYLFLTNNSAPIAKELSEKLKRLGLDIPEKHFFTSAMCTAKFLQSQKPKGGTCYVIGEPALTYALYEAGFTMSSDSPDYVVIGEGSSHNFEKITIACNLVSRGAKLISTNPDANVPSADGIVPATGAFVGTIELATGKKAFTCGKPTSLMMTSAMAMLGSEKNETCIIGNRMDMDILAGIYAQIDSVLVLTGLTKNVGCILDVAYRPYIVLNGVEDFVSYFKSEPIAQVSIAEESPRGENLAGSASSQTTQNPIGSGDTYYADTIVDDKATAWEIAQLCDSDNSDFGPESPSLAWKIAQLCDSDNSDFGPESPSPDFTPRSKRKSVTHPECSSNEDARKRKKFTASEDLAERHQLKYLKTPHEKVRLLIEIRNKIPTTTPISKLLTKSASLFYYEMMGILRCLEDHFGGEVNAFVDAWGNFPMWKFREACCGGVGDICERRLKTTRKGK